MRFSFISKLAVRTFLFVVIALPVLLAQDGRFIGGWEGKLAIPTGSLRIVLHITQPSPDKFVSTMDSPDQGAFGLKVDETVVTGNSISLTMKMLQGNYLGTIKPDGKTIDGTLTQAGRTFALMLNKNDKIKEIKRPQTPKPPFPYTEEEILIETPNPGVKLSGTLTLPKDGSNFPVVVFVTGSGPQNRDEEIFAHRPFFVIADYLARYGIASLRYDDRGVGKSKGSFAGSTTLDFAEDAMSVVKYLASRKEVNSSKIGIVGHSEGGLIAPIVAASNSDIGFIVLLAGPGIDGASLLMKQSAAIMNAARAPKEEIAKNAELNSQVYRIINEMKDSVEVSKKLDSLAEAYVSTIDTSDKSKPENNLLRLKMIMKQSLSPWFRMFLKLNPQDYLSRVACPVLALNGTKDLQVPYEDNLKAIESSLKSAGNLNYKVKALQGLNHLFQTSQTGLISEYASIEETFSPVALEEIKSFILGLK